jgi:dTDP-4-amino-4,6-dideoxygalactose transaminase
LGHIAAYSFYFSKNLGAYGEAGMLTTNDDQLARKVRLLRDHGSPQRYHHETIGMNARLDEIQAAVLRAKLPHLEAWNSQRRANAAHYTQLLSQVEAVLPPFAAEYAEHVFHLYVLRVPERDRLAAFLHDRGIGAGIHYPVPCHLQPALAYLGYRPGDLPVTESLAGEVISLPMYPELTAEQRAYVVAAIDQFYHRAGPVDVPRRAERVAG